eukprot:752162-Hanusia_phi.AAC.3
MSGCCKPCRSRSSRSMSAIFFCGRVSISDEARAREGSSASGRAKWKENLEFFSLPSRIVSLLLCSLQSLFLQRGSKKEEQECKRGREEREGRRGEEREGRRGEEREGRRGEERRGKERIRGGNESRRGERREGEYKSIALVTKERSFARSFSRAADRSSTE